MVSKTHRAPLKMLMIVDPFYPCPQSSSQRLYSFAQAFSLKGFRIAVIAGTCCLGKIKISRSPEKNYTVYDLKCPDPLLSLSSITINPFLVLLYFLFSAITAIKERPNVVFASVPNGEVAIAGFLVSRIFKIPFVVDMRDLYPFPSAREILHAPIAPSMNKLFMHIFQLLYKNSSKITCAYERIRRELRAVGVSAEKILVVTNGADTSIYRPSNFDRREKVRMRYTLPVDGLIFVYAGTLAPYYPMHDLITGFSKIQQKERNLQLLIVTFRNYESYERLAEELGLKKSVRFMGPFSVTDTAEIISACDVGLIPYPGEERFLKDMYGAKIFSYMSCGLPVLASGPPSGLLEDLIVKRHTGFFVGKPSANNFAKGFSFFLNRKGDLRRMGENARKLVEEQYDRRKIGLKLASTLHNYSKRRR